MLLAVLLTLGGCSSPIWSSINPVNWWHSQEGGAIAQQRPPPPGADQPYPNLASVPPKPAEPDRAALQNITDALIADRANAQHTAAAAPLVDPSLPSAAPGLFGVGTAPPPGPPPPNPPAGASATLATANAPPAPPAPPPAPARPPAKAPVGAVQTAPLAAPATPAAASTAAAGAASPAPATAQAALPPLPTAPPPAANVPGVPAAASPRRRPRHRSRSGDGGDARHAAGRRRTGCPGGGCTSRPPGRGGATRAERAACPHPSRCIRGAGRPRCRATGHPGGGDTDDGCDRHPGG